MISTVALIVLLAVGTASYPIYSSGTAGRCVDSAGQEVKHVHKASGSSGDCEGECTAWGASCQAYSFYPPGSMCNLYGGSVHDGSAGDYVNGWRIGGSTSVNSPVEGANAPSLPDSTSWSCHVKDESTTEASYNDWGTGNGWCSSDLDELIGSTSDASACWTMCENTYADLVAIDWTPDGECWCQDDCQCMEDSFDDDIHLITGSSIATLPNECVSACPAEEAAFQDCLSKQQSLDDDFFAGGDDDDFSPNTCDDVQQHLSNGECEGPAVCQTEYQAYVECYYEDIAREELGQTCDFTCSPDKKLSRDNSMQLFILIVFCSVAGVCCLLALGTAAAFGAFGSCACCAKKKKTPTRVAEPSAPSAPVPLAVAQYAEPPPMSPGTFAKTQEHIRRTAALMAEAPPSPGPPPLAPIKATETPSTAFAAEEAPAAEGWATETMAEEEAPQQSWRGEATETMAAEPPPPPAVEAYAPEAELEPEC